MHLKRWIHLGIITAAGVLLPLLPRLLWSSTPANVAERMWRSQAVLWIIASCVLILTILFFRRQALLFLRLNRIVGEVAPARWVGIMPGENWRRMGWQMGLTITAITAVVIALQLRPEFTQMVKILPVLPFVLLLSLSNSLGEELIYRHGVVTVLEGSAWQKHAPYFSAALFGGVHYFGAPGGLTGVLMAGFLGWLLAKSIQETGGIFWAWLIHFAQDAVIISAMFLTEITK